MEVVMLNHSLRILGATLTIAEAQSSTASGLLRPHEQMAAYERVLSALLVFAECGVSR